jgi:hypothetical protein
MKKVYRDRQNNERRIVYWLKRHLGRLEQVTAKAKKGTK